MGYPDPVGQLASNASGVSEIGVVALSGPLLQLLEPLPQTQFRLERGKVERQAKNPRRIWLKTLSRRR